MSIQSNAFWHAKCTGHIPKNDKPNSKRDCRVQSLYDVIVHSDSWQGYISQLQTLLSRFSEAHLTINLSKSEFGHAEVKFLEHTVRNQQVKPVHAKVQSVVNYPIPKSKQEVMWSLRMVATIGIFAVNFQ